MTQASVGAFGVLVLALLAVLVAVLKYIHSEVMPQIKELSTDFFSLRQAHALNQQQITQNTQRLNGQSGKIDALMLAVPPVSANVPTQSLSRPELLAGIAEKQAEVDKQAASDAASLSTQALTETSLAPVPQDLPKQDLPKLAPATV